MSVNTGRYMGEKQNDLEEVGFRISKENDKIDKMYGFERVKDTEERTGYLINMHSTEVLNEDKRLMAALDLFFIQMDGTRFKATVVRPPYFLAVPREGQALDLARYLSKKYAGVLHDLRHLEKEDLDLPNHLSGKKLEVLQLWFANQNAMLKVRRDLMAAVKRNKEREKENTLYMKMLSSSLASTVGRSETATDNPLDSIIDIREYDVPYHVRMSIDLKIFCGLWYNVRCNPDPMEMPLITPRPDLLDRPEPIVLAFDIETTKLPLKFPDAQSDQIMMISYMIDGQGYLITNREIISRDVDDFEYTPKPEFEGNFIVYNEASEKALLQKFFDHIMEVKPHIFVTYNGDFFDWPFVETRAAIYDLDMKREIGFSKERDGTYLCRPAMHMDCLCWVKRDSYLPVGSQGLKAVAKAKLRYDPVELDPEEMCKMAVEQPQVLSNYSVSDAVATYYLYMKYVHPFIFALATIIPMEPDEVLRKGSGTLCESLLMKEAKEVNVLFPNKQMAELNKLTSDGHVIDTETYVGGHVEALESGVFRADIPCKFKIDQKMILRLQSEVDKVLVQAIEVEEGVPLGQVSNLQEVRGQIMEQLQKLHDVPARVEQPVIVHLDVGAMYPNIILTNRLQPSAMVTDHDCVACDFNRPGALCKRNMEWLWRGDMLPANKNEFQRIQQQLETEKFPPVFPGGPQRAFHELSKEDQAAYEKKRLQDYCRKAYKKVKVTKMETRTSTICQKENSFYVDTVRAFRDRRYEYKGLTKVAKAAVVTAVKSGDASEIKAAKGREVLYDSLQLAHKCILNSFYGYVMRKGARWMSMPMAGIVCLTGANIITKAREIIEKVGRPLELDTDGIWCILPATFPQEFTVQTSHEKKKKFNISYPNAVLNSMVKDHFTNEQYHVLTDPGDGKDRLPEYKVQPENSIFFEVDGPYLAMVLPAAKEEGKKLKKRYAVFNFDGTLAELKGFEVKRRGELQLIKIFQSSVFEAFLQGGTLEQCYASVAKVADYWLDVLYSKGHNMPDSELFELISENRSMSKKLEEYGGQKSTSISTAKRLAEFLGDQMVKDAGLACRYIISRKPEGAPVTERAIPLAIFQSDANVRRHYLRKWLKDSTIGDADIREILDWNYYIERLGGAIQKIITIPAALQGLSNPVPRVQHPDWLHKKVLEKNDILKQRKINEIFAAKERPAPQPRDENTDTSNALMDIEDIAGDASPRLPVVTTKRRRPNSPEPETVAPKTWREAVGSPPEVTSKKELVEWVRFQKRKWRWQLDQRKKLRDPQRKRSRTEGLGVSRPAITTVAGFMRKNQRALLDRPWQIIQAFQTGDMGNFLVWAIVDSELHKIKLVVPRIFYVNQRVVSPPSEDGLWKKVNRVLPRARPVQNLYRYAVPEKVFHENQLGMLVDLATPDIEGIYETQMSLEFRLLMDIGCVCKVDRAEAQKIAVSTRDTDTFTLTQLEFKTVNQAPYLENLDSLKRIFLYQHSILSGKREIWGLFMEATKKAIIVVHDTVRSNQLPNLKNLYATERQAFMRSKEDSSLPVEEFTFTSHLCLDSTEVSKHLTKALGQYQSEKKGPTVVCMQTFTSPMLIVQNVPILTEFPQIPIHITDDASLLSGLEWQRLGVRSVMRHFLNLNTVLSLMLDQCKYFHIPIGNMPKDCQLFGADLFFSRLLQKHNFVLWWSPTNRPDLGGRESDDNRLLAEFEDNISVVQNKPGFYPHVCVELAIDSLAVSALLQAFRIQDMEGASSAITFDVLPNQASIDEMIGNTPTGSLPTYDETTLCSAAFRVLRQMVNTWLREVSLHRNVYSDYQIVHFYRWIRSSHAFLYDPALRRTLNTLMRKLFLQIVAEFQRLGAEVVYADFNKLIIHTKKKTPADAIANADYMVQSLRNKELFHSIHLSFQQSWDFLLWLDTTNYAGIRGVLPSEMRDTNEMSTQEDEITLEMNWAISDYLPTDVSCRDNFENFVSQFMEILAEGKTSVEAVKAMAHTAYEMVQTMHQDFSRVKEGPALEFIKTVVKILSVDDKVTEELSSVRRNMLRLIGVGEFSDAAEWREPRDSYVLSEVICKACNHCRDLDLCKDKHRAAKNGKPVWLCAQCLVCYDNQEIEVRIIDVVQRKLMSYTLQDLRCVRCKQIKRENMSAYCGCAGDFETLISSDKLKSLLGETLMSIADKYEMILLKELLTTVLRTFKK